MIGGTDNIAMRLGYITRRRVGWGRLLRYPPNNLSANLIAYPCATGLEMLGLAGLIEPRTYARDIDGTLSSPFARNHVVFKDNVWLVESSAATRIS